MWQSCQRLRNNTIPISRQVTKSTYGGIFCVNSRPAERISDGDDCNLQIRVLKESVYFFQEQWNKWICIGDTVHECHINNSSIISNP